MLGTSSEIEELKQDAEEARALLASATRKKWKDILSAELLKIETKLNSIQIASESNSSNNNTNSKSLATPSLVTSAASKVYTTLIRNYSWDQSDKFLKIYLTLKGIHTLNKENISCTFGEQTLTFKALELDGKNHELNISRLAYPIVSDGSHFKVKTDMVVVFAAKAKTISWEVVTAEEKRVLDLKKVNKPDVANRDDPTAGLMGLMKQMYDDGDDDMKKMLNKTWYESQQKNSKGPSSNLPNFEDMNI